MGRGGLQREFNRRSIRAVRGQFAIPAARKQTISNRHPENVCLIGNS